MNGFFFRFILLFAAVFAVIFLFVWFYLSVTAPAEAGEHSLYGRGESIEFETAQLDVLTRDGKTHTFKVEMAMTPAQQRRGLMFREHLAQDQGMLFDYVRPRGITMWMKNTPISLDMLFADSQGRVSHIATYTEPFSLKLISAPMRVRYVLEVPAGTVETLQLQIGDRLRLH